MSVSSLASAEEGQQGSGDGDIRFDIRGAGPDQLQAELLLHGEGASGRPVGHPGIRWTVEWHDQTAGGEGGEHGTS